MSGQARLPENAAHLTFDDGFVDHYATVYPILRRRGLSGTFFVAEETCGAAPRVLDVHKTHFLLAHLGAEAFGRAVLDETQRGRAARAAPTCSGSIGGRPPTSAPSNDC